MQQNSEVKPDCKQVKKIRSVFCLKDCDVYINAQDLIRHLDLEAKMALQFNPKNCVISSSQKMLVSSTFFEVARAVERQVSEENIRRATKN